MWMVNLDVAMDKLTKSVKQMNIKKVENIMSGLKNKKEGQVCELAASSKTGVTDLLVESSASKSLHAELEKEDINVRDSLFGAHHHLNTTGLHIGSEKDEAALAIIRTNSCYLETGLKMMRLAETEDDSLECAELSTNHYLASLGTILKGAIVYNRQAYQALLARQKGKRSTNGSSGVKQQGRDSFPSQICCTHFLDTVESVYKNCDCASPSVDMGLYPHPQGCIISSSKSECWLLHLN